MTAPSSRGTASPPPTSSRAPHTPPEAVDAEDWSPGRGVPARQKARRRLRRWSELRPLLQFEKLELVPSRRRLHQATTIEDLRRAARYRVPRSVFEFVDGGAEDELTLARNRAAFDRVEFSPHALGGAATVDTSTTLFGHRATARPRPGRILSAGPPRRGTCRRPSRRLGRYPVRAHDDGHHLHRRSGGGGWTPGATLVPALRHA